MRLRAFADRHETPSPCLLIDLPTLESTYRTMSLAFIGAEILYAVKANAAPGVITTFARLGAGFDVASLAEIELCLARGVPASRLSFSNPVKKRSDVAAAYERGVRTFAFDNPGDLRNIIVGGARLEGLLPHPGDPAGRRDAVRGQVRLPRGGRPGDARRRPPTAVCGLRGVMFHVGSQQRNLAAWDAGIAAAAKIAKMLEPEGVRLPVIDIGGGFPISYLRTVGLARGVRAGGRPVARPPLRAPRASATGHRAGPIPRRSGRDDPRGGGRGAGGAFRADPPPVGVPRRRPLQRPGGDRERHHRLPHPRPVGLRPRRARSCWPDRPATATTCSTSAPTTPCRCRSPRATRSRSWTPGRTRPATPAPPSTACPRCRPSACRADDA